MYVLYLYAFTHKKSASLKIHMLFSLAWLTRQKALVIQKRHQCMNGNNYSIFKKHKPVVSDESLASYTVVRISLAHL